MERRLLTTVTWAALLKRMEKSNDEKEATEYAVVCCEDIAEEFGNPTPDSPGPSRNIETWTFRETETLIDIYNNHKDDFAIAKTRKHVWRLVAEDLANYNIHKAPDKCDIKWRNLLRAYRGVKFNTNITTRKAPSKFLHFDKMNAILGNKPAYSRNSILNKQPERTNDTNEILVKFKEPMVTFDEPPADPIKEPIITIKEYVVRDDSEPSANELFRKISAQTNSLRTPKKLRKMQDPRTQYLKRKIELQEKEFELKVRKHEDKMALEWEKINTLKELLLVQRELLKKQSQTEITTGN